MFKIFEKMFKETKDFDDVMIKNDKANGELVVCYGYVTANRESILNPVNNGNPIKIIPGEKIFVNRDITFYSSVRHIWWIPAKVFKIKIECEKYIDDYCSGGKTAYSAKSIFVEDEVSFSDLKSGGLFGEGGRFCFVENEEDFNRLDEISYSELIAEKTKVVMRKLGYGEKFTNMLLRKFDNRELYNKIQTIEVMEEENVNKNLIIFAIFGNDSFSIKDILNFGGNIYEQ